MGTHSSLSMELLSRWSHNRQNSVTSKLCIQLLSISLWLLECLEMRHNVKMRIYLNKHVITEVHSKMKGYEWDNWLPESCKHRNWFVQCHRNKNINIFFGNNICYICLH